MGTRSEGGRDDLVTINSACHKETLRLTTPRSIGERGQPRRSFRTGTNTKAWNITPLPPPLMGFNPHEQPTTLNSLLRSTPAHRLRGIAQLRKASWSLKSGNGALAEHLAMSLQSTALSETKLLQPSAKMCVRIGSPRDLVHTQELLGETGGPPPVDALTQRA